MTLTRYPNGIDGGSFYQKHVEDPPPFVNTVEIYSSHNEGDSSYITVDNLATLVWLAQLADIELHPWSSRTVGEPDAAQLPAVFHGSREVLEGSVLNYPDFIVFDLDPYIYSGREKTGDEPELNRAAFASTRTVALALRQVLDQLSLSSFVKTSGKTGLHIYVPIVRQYDYRSVRKVCETIGGFLLRQRPRDVTMEWSVEKRTGKVFFDHQPELARQEHGVDLLAQAAAGRARLHTRQVGRAGACLSDRLHHRHGARARSGDWRPLGRHPGVQA